MRKLSEFAQPYVVVWAWHQVFRKLGFSSDDIHVRVSRNGAIAGAPLWVFVLLISQDKELCAEVCPMTIDGDVFITTWQEFARLFNANAFAEEELTQAYEACMADRTVAIVSTLLDKGFVMPFQQKKLN